MANATKETRSGPAKSLVPAKSVRKHGDRHKVKCDICKHQHDFQMPEDILDAVRGQRLVLFAGSGISTESSAVMPYTFYDEIAAEVGSDTKAITLSFPDLMSECCKQPNGRRRLLQKLRSRFEYIESFPAILSVATRFHQELSTIPHLDHIVTTNWDSYFERFCGAIPFVTSQDFVFWDMPGRKVFKIHGSVDSYGSIVATMDDYNQCHEQLTKGLVGSNLKMLLATKVVVFVGYSLRDHDFSRIYNLLKEETNGLVPHAYAVSVSHESAERFKSMGLTPIVTDGAFFLSVLKQHLVAEHRMVPDERFTGILAAWDRVQAEHRSLHQNFSYQKNPEIVHCAAYQDGLTDAFGRIMTRQNTGEYSCPDHVRAVICKYLDIQRDKRTAKKYADVAYVEGYVNGLQYLVFDDQARKSLPLYYVFGHNGEIRTLSQYKKACRNARSLHRAAYENAVALTRQCGNGIELHHSPFLR